MLQNNLTYQQAHENNSAFSEPEIFNKLAAVNAPSFLPLTMANNIIVIQFIILTIHIINPVVTVHTTIQWYIYNTMSSAMHPKTLISLYKSPINTPLYTWVLYFLGRYQ